MHIFESKKWKFPVLGVVLCAALGCAGGKAYDYQTNAGEMKQGPGALTGESGELTIYDSKKGGLLPKEDAPKAATATAAAAQAGQQSTDSSKEAQEFQEFPCAIWARLIQRGCELRYVFVRLSKFLFSSERIVYSVDARLS